MKNYSASKQTAIITSIKAASRKNFKNIYIKYIAMKEVYNNVGSIMCTA